MDGLGFPAEQKRDPTIAGVPITAESARQVAAPALRKPLDIARVVDAIRARLG
jgi:hypothetical protein